MCCVLLMASEVNAQSIGSVQKRKFQISGSVGVPGVLMKVSGVPGIIKTDASGQYTITVDFAWKGTITPILEGYTFTPRVQSVGPARADQSNLDFKGEMQMFVVSGTTSLPNVVLRGFTEPVASDSQGNFSVKVPYGTSAMIVPELDGYSFTPSNLELTKINRNYSGQRFYCREEALYYFRLYYI